MPHEISSYPRGNDEGRALADAASHHVSLEQARAILGISGDDVSMVYTPELEPELQVTDTTEVADPDAIRHTKEVFALYEERSKGLLDSESYNHIYPLSSIVYDEAAGIPEDINLDDVAAIFSIVEAGEMDLRAHSDYLSQSPIITFQLMDKISPVILQRIANDPDHTLRDKLLMLTEKAMDVHHDSIWSKGLASRAKLLGYKDSVDYVGAWFDDNTVDAAPAQHGIDLGLNLHFVFEDYPYSSENNLDEKRDFATRYIRNALKIPEDLAGKMVTAMDERIRISESDRRIYPAKHIEELKAICEARKVLRAKDCALVHEKTGMVNFGKYSAEQLERMNQLAKGDDALLEQLRSGPVMLVLRDALGDHNGALDRTAKLLEGDSATTLFFELSSAENEFSELGKYAALLANYGIKYDTVVIAAHGNDDGFQIGNEMVVSDELYVDDIKKRKGAHSVYESAGLHALFKGIEPDEVNQATILLMSCKQGARDNRLQLSMLEVLCDLAASEGASGYYDAYGFMVSTNIDTNDKRDILVKEGFMSHVEITPGGRVSREADAYHGVRLKGLLSQEGRAKYRRPGEWARRQDAA